MLQQQLAAVCTALLLASLPLLANGMNWAQAAGNKTQPVVNAAYNGWTARWGQGLIPDETNGILYVLGGDDFRGTADGGGAFHNDVWKTTGAQWSVYEKLLTADPVIQSKLSWVRVWPDKVAPPGTEYEDWIECYTRQWQGLAKCLAEDDPYSGDLRRWSPRRNHATLYFDNGDAGVDTLWVIGGFASDEPRTNHEPKHKNDVWSSSDGAVWTIVNPGCRFEDVQAVPGIGAQHAPCSSDIDCYGDSRCFNILTGAAASTDRTSVWNRCRCQTFPPRERHAVSVFENKMYISGGITSIQVTDCGDFPCNGGYQKLADDLWWSSTGATWTQVTTVAHAYSDHGLIESGGILWIVSLYQEPVDALHNRSSSQTWKNENGGVFLKGVAFPRSTEQLSIPNDKFDEKFIYIENNDFVYKYVEGEGWQEVSEDTNNVIGTRYVWPDAPVARIQGEITAADVIALNDHGVRTIRELSQLDAATVVDLRANFNVTLICHHVKRALAVINKCKLEPYVPDGHLNLIYDTPIQSPMTDPIPYLRGAIADSTVTDTTAVDTADSGDLIYGYDGCQQAELVEEQYPSLDEIPALQADAERGFIPDLTCRWGFNHRTKLAAVNFAGKQYVLGGQITERPVGNVLQEQGDTWYRDDTVPVTLMEVRPDDRTSDTVFQFACDEDGCIYEYMLEEINEDDGSVLSLLVEWTRSVGYVDFLSWLPGGMYRIKVRAIDPAGNIDNHFEEGRNQLTWKYIPKIPLGLILGILLVFMLIGLAVYLEIRRRKKKAALERYALKRMRRKFKGMQKRNAKTKEDKKGGKKKKGTKVAPGKKKGDGEKKKGKKSPAKKKNGAKKTAKK